LQRVRPKKSHDLAGEIARLRAEQAGAMTKRTGRKCKPPRIGNDQLEQLKLEATLIGQTNAVRAVAIAQLQAEQFLKAHPGSSLAER
jgi:hypothetical protein